MAGAQDNGGTLAPLPPTQSPATAPVLTPSPTPAPAPPADERTPSANSKSAASFAPLGETASSTYRLQPYDLLDVEVYSEEDLHKPARLGADGTVLLPLIGSVKIGGMTVAEATELITNKYANGYVKSPRILITVMQYRKSTFSILGQVMRPGIYEIPEGAHVTIIEAISLSGGFTQLASQNAVTLKRSADGKNTLYKIRAADMAQSTDTAPFEILAGDTLDVPSTTQGSFSLLGQVSRPGLYAIPGGSKISIIEAISLAGGFTTMAQQNGITVKRIVDGKQTMLTVKAADIARDPSAEQFEVLAGDSLLVPFRNSTFLIDGQVNKPGIYEIPEGGHVNIIEAVLMAGGYTRIAAQNGVLVKRQVGGKFTMIKVHAGDMAKDPDLIPFEMQPGDIVTVKETWY